MAKQTTDRLIHRLDINVKILILILGCSKNMLPVAFNHQGVLPVGEYRVSIDELRRSLLVIGPLDASPEWDTKWRLKLVDNLEILVGQLFQIGATEIFVDGSFVENVNRPNDVDGYFVCSVSDVVNRVIERKLNEIDPNKAWGWDDHLRHPGRTLPLARHYQVVLWPYSPGTMFGRVKGRPAEMSEAFRRTKVKQIPKGIVKIEPSGAKL